jgi:hypothetical protein
LAGIVVTRKRQAPEINKEQLAKAQEILERDE